MKNSNEQTHENNGMTLKLMRLLMGDLSWLDGKQADIKEMLQRYFLLLVRFLVVVSAIAMLFIVITAVQLITPFSWMAVDLKLDGQTLANYVGIVLGSVVALAGSLVAIVIAQRTVIVSEDSNRLAVTQTPEYTDAFQAATAYAVFKGYTILLPLQLRKMQRNGRLSDGAIDGLSGGESSSGKVRDELVEKLFDSVLLSFLPGLASKACDADTMREFQQRKAEALFSDIKDSPQFMMGFSASLRLISLIDELVERLHGDVSESPTYKEYVHNLENPESRKLTTVEFWFIKHAYPHTQTNKELQFGDLLVWAEEVKNNFLADFDLNHPIKFEKKFKGNTFVKISSGDYGLYELNENLQRLFPTYEIELVPNQWEKYFKSRLFDAGENKDRKFILILDQLEMYGDSFIFNNSFNLSEQLFAWKFFSKLLHILNHNFNEADFDEAGKSMMVADLEREGATDFMRKDSASDNLDLTKDYLTQAAIELNLPGIHESEGEIHQYIKNISHMLYALAIGARVGFNLHEDELKLFVQPEVRKLIEHLAVVPFFERPFYCWSDVACRKPENFEIYANLFVNDQMHVPYNIVAEWLIAASNYQVCID